jgi:hypothetical protein
LIKEIYRGENWIGGLFPPGWSPGGKAERCIGQGPAIYISICMNDVNKCVELKEKCRDLFRIGKHSLHISDYTSDTWRISTALLNNNSINYLNNGTNEIREERKKMLKNYFDNVNKNKEFDKDDYLITDISNKISYIKMYDDDEKLYNPQNYYYINGYKIYKDIVL